MERDLVVPSWAREAAAFGGDLESTPSRSSSGCQSGWTLYLDHSNGGVRCLPCDAAAAQRWVVLQPAEHADEEEEDSMASDASSGPRPCQRDGDDNTRPDFVFEQHPGSCRHSCYSSSTTVHYSASGSGSGCFGSSTWSRGSQGEVHAGHVRTRAAEAATRHYHEIVVVDDDEDDELDDTASSSSAVFSGPRPVVHVNFSS
ncbi:hypothetical protein BS78_06G055400 [Paspalum vaginatum]|nr:hypothetical protein BS78_06G055400 [Paspalum vaginatum]